MEEQRYLARMQRAHNIQEQAYSKHYETITKHEIEKKKRFDADENDAIERRLNSL